MPIDRQRKAVATQLLGARQHFLLELRDEVQQIDNGHVGPLDHALWQVKRDGRRVVNRLRLGVVGHQTRHLAQRVQGIKATRHRTSEGREGTAVRGMAMSNRTAVGEEFVAGQMDRGPRDPKSGRLLKDGTARGQHDEVGRGDVPAPKRGAGGRHEDVARAEVNADGPTAAVQEIPTSELFEDVDEQGPLIGVLHRRSTSFLYQGGLVSLLRRRPHPD